MEDDCKKISIDEYELKGLAEQLTSAAGRLLAMCEANKAKDASKKEKKSSNPIAKTALMLKLKS